MKTITAPLVWLLGDKNLGDIIDAHAFPEHHDYREALWQAEQEGYIKPINMGLYEVVKTLHESVDNPSGLA